jgi:Cu/Ag efflux protein CusF
VFALLVTAFALGLWGTVVRPPAYEVRGRVLARPAADMLLVRHEAVRALGMTAMELMAVFGEPAVLDASGVRPGDEVRLAVRQKDERLVVLRIERRP